MPERHEREVRLPSERPRHLIDRVHHTLELRVARAVGREHEPRDHVVHGAHEVELGVEAAGAGRALLLGEQRVEPVGLLADRVLDQCAPEAQVAQHVQYKSSVIDNRSDQINYKYTNKYKQK